MLSTSALVASAVAHPDVERYTMYNLPTAHATRTTHRALAQESDDAQFTHAALRRVAPHNKVILTFVNKVRIDFAHTWVAHMKRLRLTNYLVGATDEPALQALKLARIPCFSMKTNLPQGEWPWGSPSFKSLGPHKIELIYKSIGWGFEVIITDIDALVLREPFAYMARWPDAGFLTTSDHLGNTTHDGGLENHRGIHSAFNIGYMFFRKSAMPLVVAWRDSIAQNPRDKWDQGEFNSIARRGWKVAKLEGLSDPRLFWSYQEKVIGGVLPISLFCGGHNYFVSQFPQRLGVEPYSIHTTFQYSAAPGKRHRLREAGVWYDEPAYYAPSGGVLAVELEVPPDMIHPPGGMDTIKHILLMKHQLRQIRSALALAISLGRMLVMPEVVCGYDKAWYALSGGRSKGAFGGAPGFAVPIYRCPLDHYLEVGMLKPVQTIREYSFLRNPRVPASFSASSANVTLSGSVGTGGVAKLANDHKGVKVLRVTDTLPDWDKMQGMLTAEQLAQVTPRLRVAGGWCCAPTEDKGMPKSAHWNLLHLK